MVVKLLNRCVLFCTFLEPLDDAFCRPLYRLARNIQQRHRRLRSAGMFFEPVGKVEHADYECFAARATPGRTRAQALYQCFVGAEEGKIVDGAEIAAVGAGFQPVGQGRAEEDGGTTALVDGDGHAEPHIPIASVIIFGCSRDMAPQDVAIQADVSGQLWREFDAERGFTGAAGAGDDEEGKLAKRVLVATVGADGIRPDGFYGLLV